MAEPPLDPEKESSAFTVVAVFVLMGLLALPFAFILYAASGAIRAFSRFM